MSPEATFIAQASGQPTFRRPQAPSIWCCSVPAVRMSMCCRAWVDLCRPGVKITPVTPHSRQWCAGMIPGFVAGHYPLGECVIPLEKLLVQSGARLIQSRAVALVANAQTVPWSTATPCHTTG